ncbi:glycoside hydrolase family 88/105 protein [Niabella beijingensis]|uniref:glycoside hydrolase family 88/105 protein n=1 Tax=Niabella beijingensis TaxID=2872700 RepID=UPI001CBD8CE2|nr:glycoside hydrolase family 88 protein [Niabella beijingensis]MBZ4190412.1 glycoside hydrolase family 88 protein [Niabella beijingensis]
MKKCVLFRVRKKFVYGIICLFCLSFFSLPAGAQKENIEAVVHSVAGNIIRNTSYKFIDTKTKTVYTSTGNFPAEAEIRTQSLYNRWEYSNGVMMIGMLKAAEAFGRKEYADYVLKNFDFVFKNADYFKKVYAAKKRSEWAPFFRMGSLDDCGAMSAALTDANEKAKDKRYQEYLSKAADYILNKQLRLNDGTLSRNNPHNMTLWADDLYMSVPFLARMGRLTGENRYFDDAVKQVLNFNKYLYNPGTGLYYHCWYSDLEQNGVAHWLRCNGWIAMAQVELLNNLPRNHPKRNELIKLLTRQLIGLSRFQDPGGLWHQVMNKPDSYLETSGTAMFVYAIARAVNEKWIPASYKSIAMEGWKGLVEKIRPDGNIADVCIGTGIADNVSFYYNRPKVVNDFHALGAVLLAGTEMLRLDTGR